MLFSFFSPKFDNFFWFLLDTSGKIDACAAHTGDSAAAFAGGEDRDFEGLQHRRDAEQGLPPCTAASVPRSASQHHGKGDGGRRQLSASRRGKPGAQRRIVSGRAAGVFAGDAGGAAAAAGGAPGVYFQNQRHLHLSGKYYVSCGDESLSVRKLS